MSYQTKGGKNKLAAPLVSACRHLLQTNGSIIGDQVANAILPNFPDLCSALPADYFADRQALLGVGGGGGGGGGGTKKPLTHSRIRNFILRELGPQLHQLGYGRGDRIALVLPNGPELALAILGVSHWASCLPLNANGAPSELQKDLKLAKAQVIVGMAGDDSAAIRDMARALHIPFCALEPSKSEIGIFHLIPASIGDIVALTRNSSLRLADQQQQQHHNNNNNEDDKLCNMCVSHEYRRVDSMEVLFPNEHDDEVLVLFTSGTTGSKKLVPHTLADMLIAAACIAVSWNLSPEDVNCNLMPLFHVGGIVRQVFAPILSAGAVICCPSFDPSLFWQLLLRPKKAEKTSSTTTPTTTAEEEFVTTFSWYYAAPTMHQVILESMPAALEAAKAEYGQECQPRLRMIANAAGGLLPSLAEELRKAFGGANILPSYGMTECMPISSPPHNYELTKPGTSGVAVGPQVTIFNSNFEILPPGKEGSICVRGRPCFHGYGGQPKNSSFLEGGWFNTGDLGYLDEDGYLYITGRSKEVINRGGEIISPMEVEEEVLSHSSVMACAAFSAAHTVLQEVVGIVIVPSSSVPRIDLPTLHEYLEPRLATAKWPQVLVFMDALPKSHTNKLLRVKLGQRLNLPEMNDGMFPLERTFEANCPPQGTPVGVAIPCERISIEPEYVQGILQNAFASALSENKEARLLVVNHPSRFGSLIVHVKNMNRQEIIRTAKTSLDAYLQPSHVCLHTEDSAPLTIECCEGIIPQSTDAVGFLAMTNGVTGENDTVMDPMIKELQELIQDLVDLDCLPSPDTSFFQVGGTSLLASQLASKIRKKYSVSFSGADIFRHNCCFAMAKRIKSQKPEFQNEKSKEDGGDSMKNGSQCSPNFQGISFDPTRLKPRKNILKTLLQLLPGFGVFPVWQFSRFFLFFVSLLEVLHRVPFERNLIEFICTVVVFHFIWNVLSPLLFVLIKWTVIGRYKKGRYAFWSVYYLRWWFVDVCRKIFGRGVWGSSNDLLVIFYRLLGANIASDARLSLSAEIAEYDLVTIGNDASIEYATIRGFGVDNGAMILGPVEVGKSSSVGIRSVVAPFTRVPDGCHVGPGTSSYEISSEDDSHLANNRYAVEEPNLLMQTFVGSPITFLVATVSHVPTMYVLYLMIIMKTNQYDDGDYSFENVGDLLEWLADPARIPYYLGIRVARNVIAPIIYMMAALVVKWTIIGKFHPGPRDTSSQWQLMRQWLAAALFSRENVQNVADLLGRHYELTSRFYRLLGAKVGKRVFWPGHQPVFSGEFDLLEVGDDVVFGSRSAVIMSTSHSYEKVVFCAGANISDNTIVLPGSIIAKNAVLGSNTVCPAGRYLPPGTTWLGSRFGEPELLESNCEGDNQVIFSKDVKESDIELVGDESTLRPFGRAVYLGGTKYFVCPPFLMSIFNILCASLITMYHALPLLGSIHLSTYQIYGPRGYRDYDIAVSSMECYKIMVFDFVLLHAARVILCFAIAIGAKWLLIGRRTMGRYNWDESSYNQRWEFHQIISEIKNIHRVSTLDFIAGTPLLDWYFRALGSKVGQDCCLYPAGGDPYMPEPDMVTFGDGVVLDVASVVSHLNTRGNFELVPIKLDPQSTLRTRSRVQQGVHIESGSMLLEKSLAMTGEVIEYDSIWQGSPAQRVSEYSSLTQSPSVSFGMDSSEKYYELV